MTAMLWLLPVAIALGLCGLVAFFWANRTGQFDDLQGDGSRILTDEDHPIIDYDSSPETKVDKN